MAFRIAVVDPSAFTIPYDDHLCRGLAANGCHVTLLTRRSRGLDDYSNSLNGDGDGAHPAYTKRDYFYRFSEWLPFVATVPPVKRGLKATEHLWNMAALCRMLRDHRPDVIHFQWSVVPLVDQYFVERLRRIAPCVLTVHDPNAFLAPSSRLQKLGWHALLQTFDGLIVHTISSQQAMIAKGVEASRISIIPHGVFDVSAGNCRQSINETSGRCVLLAFGSIKPYKGTDLIIRAVAEMPAELRQRVRLVIAGNPGKQESDLRQLAIRLEVNESIDWMLRYIPDREVPTIVSQCDAIVFPYYEIDASGALMSLLAYGKAIVASRLGLFAEFLQDGQTAYLTQPGDASALAAAICKVVNDPTSAQKMGQRSAALAQTVLSWNRIAQLTIVAYGEAAKNHWRKDASFRGGSFGIVNAANRPANASG
jgi:glycosyltransferase involved in cell wall biosynthesis